ncbi:GntR family transcriptional regulator [Salinibacillus xinjiangensis]|uniref:UTRA domain-containing protein n=1 Tax=Salinibacillus xinjiangensis TaxID=1229268 RepID=A0A6G1X2C5_9BACI|nr:GntR family transcriptional regulator [Salinibacillus xinjiangensis]MRG85050.1 UTRA domain-containing protein [Salinibacillus xinjiangensis]
MPLDYTNSIPLHIQLKREIENKIFTGYYIHKIPSERELMDDFHVSRSTVREAIGLLEREGIIEKKRGIGTFVSVKPIDDWLGNLSSTSETIERMGMEPGAELIDSKIINLKHDIQKKTGLQRAYFFKRIRFANHIPIGIESHYYPIDIGQELVKYDLNKEALYDLLERQLGVKTFEAEQVIKSTTLSSEDSKLMNLPLNSNMLYAERLLKDVNGKFVELENAIYRSDMYSFKIKLSRKNM